MPGHSGEEAGLDNRFGWRGYWYDPRLQLYHVRNRAYDPRQGQWLQTDPLGFSAGDQNLYRYADGNYASGYDPTGLDPADGSEGAPYVIPQGPDGQDQLRRMYNRSGTVYGVISRAGGGTVKVVVNNNNHSVTIIPTDSQGIPEAHQVVQQSEATNMTRPAQQMHAVAVTAVLVEELIIRTVFTPVDIVWSAVEIVDNPKDVTNYISVIPFIGKVAKVRATVKDAQGITRTLVMDTQTAAKIEKGEAKLVQEGEQLVVKEGKAAETCSEGVQKSAQVTSTLRKIDLYPKVIDPRTGRHIPFPTGVDKVVPKAERVRWGSAEKDAFIKEWYQRGYAEPRGGWEHYDIHHIHPREYGGGNEFWNLVPVERGTHQGEFNSFWRFWREMTGQ